jgi:uncharacterized membrane protein YqaE (UPF0057 family)
MRRSAVWDRRGGWLPIVIAVASALLFIGPALRPGYILTYDMVFVPRQPITAELFGLGTSTPRAVPSQLAVALGSHVIAADWLQKLVLVGCLALGGVGAAWLAPVGLVGRTAAGLAYLWSPYVGQRLILGQWPMLLVFASLPWMVRACAGVRAGTNGAWPRLLLWTALCCLAGAPGWIVAVLVVPLGVLLRHGRGGRELARDAVLTIAGLTVFALPWAVPALLRPVGLSTDRAAAAVFAARADTALGTVGSLLVGGGGWNAQANPAGRGGLLYAVGVVLVLVVAALGVARLGFASMPGLWVSALLALGLGIGSAVPWLRDAFAGLPAGGLLRDAPRYLLPWILAVAVGFGAGVDRMRTDPRLRQLAVLVALLPVALLPSLAWGVGARLHAVRYPAEMAQVRRIVSSKPGAVLVAPLTTYRAFPWNGSRTSLDPYPRLFDQRVVYASDLSVGIGDRIVVIRGDDPMATRIQRELRRGPAASVLAREGIHTVVVTAAQPPFDVAGLDLRYRGPDVAVYGVPGASGADPAAGLTPPVMPVVIGDTVATVSICAVAYWSVICLIRSRDERRSRGNRRT